MTTIYYTTAPASTATHLPRAARSFAPDADLALARTPAGKPYFPAAPGLHCAVSHSSAVWLCACSDAPVGVDVQHCADRTHAQNAALARRFFHPDETAYLDAHPESFYAIWCAKEACAKLTGRGIDGEFARFSVVADGGLASPIAGTQLHLATREGYCFALVCADGDYAAERI